MRDENDWIELLREREARIAELETLLSDVTTRWRDTVATLCELTDADDAGVEETRI